MNCPLRPNHLEFVTFGVNTEDTVSNLPIQAKRACSLLECCKCNKSILVKVTALPTTGTNTISLLTCCGTSIPAIAASTGDAVTASQLTVNSWYEVMVSRTVNGYRATFVVL